MLTSISNVCLVCGMGTSQKCQLFAMPALASLPRGVVSFEHELAQCAPFQLPAVIKFL